jgi:two-component system NarL family response regulator
MLHAHTDTADGTARGVDRIRVMVVDDFPMLREAIVRALDADVALEVVAESGDGDDALARAIEVGPDVLILDLRLPGRDGLEVLEQLRTRAPKIRVVVMTANEQPRTLLDAIAAGAVGYVSKRSTAVELRQAVFAAHSGGSFITPSLAGHLLTEFSTAARGERSAVRPLRGRELEVLRLVVNGKTDNEIAMALFISPRTVQNTLARIREKTGLRRRSELTRWAVEHQIG